MWKCVILALVVPFIQLPPDRMPPTIRKHAVGPVAVGAAAESVYSALRGRTRLVDLGLEGQLSPALELTFPNTQLTGGVLAELVPRNNALIVWRISVKDPAIRTAKGSESDRRSRSFALPTRSPA